MPFSRPPHLTCAVCILIANKTLFTPANLFLQTLSAKLFRPWNVSRIEWISVFLKSELRCIMCLSSSQVLSRLVFFPSSSIFDVVRGSLFEVGGRRRRPSFLLRTRSSAAEMKWNRIVVSKELVVHSSRETFLFYSLKNWEKFKKSNERGKWDNEWMNTYFIILFLLR